jgi:hypothetical protein
MPRNNEYLVSDVALADGLQTGLQVPAVPFCAYCTVVVVRGPEDLADARMRRRLLRLQRPDTVHVWLWRQELEDGEECLWPEVTALVPFRDWARLEFTRGVDARYTWTFTREPFTVHGVLHEEANGRDIVSSLQEEIFESLNQNAAGREDYTLFLYTR